MSYDSFYFPNLSVDSMDVGSGVQSKRGTLANPRVKDWLNNILQSGGGSSMDTFGQPPGQSPVNNNDPLAGQGAYGYNGAVPWERLTPQQRIDWAKGQPGTANLFTARQSQIETTLKQFSNVKSVIISINGRTEDILQP